VTDDLDAVRAALLSLTPAQQAAVEALATGVTHREAANIAGVCRETVTGWVGHHPGVRAALETFRVALATEQANKARAIRGRALAIVEAQLDGADLAMALAVLRAIPVPTDPGPAGALTAEAILGIELQRDQRSTPSEPRTDDPLALLEDELSGVAAQRRRAQALSRIADAAGVGPAR